MAGFYPPPPSNFRVLNRDQDPVALFKLGWAEPDYDSSYVYTNDVDRLTNSLYYATAYTPVLNGFRLFRDTSSPDFTPTGESEGEGNCIKDENTLTPSIFVYTDYDVSPDQTYYYKIVAIFEEF